MAIRSERFEDLPVWQAAADLYGFAEGLLVQPELVASPGWRDQFDRAALSISSYVAHGFECGSASDRSFAIVQARAAVGEVRSMLRVLERRKIPREVQVPVSRLKALAESCSQQLREWGEQVQEAPLVEVPAARPPTGHPPRATTVMRRRTVEVARKILGILPNHQK